eukprot:g4157.t1
MNPQTSKIAPKTKAIRKLSSTGALGFGPQLPVRTSMKMNRMMMYSSISNRLLAEETKALQCHFEEILESCQATAHADLAKFLESKVNLNEIWQSTYGITWNPTEDNLKTLSHNFLQSCKLRIRAESIGRPDPRKVVRRFAVSVVTDIYKLRNEFWESTYESDVWEDIHLVGDKDAHYAGMIAQYLETDLPWDKLTAWLKENRTRFRNTPPSWLTIEWLDLLPKDVRADVWDNAQYGDLKYRIREVEKAFLKKMSTKKFLPKLKNEPKPSKTDSAQGIIPVKDDSVPDTSNMKPNKYLDKNTKMKIHPKYEKDLKNDSATDNDVPDSNPNKKDTKMKIHPKKENDLYISSENDKGSLDKPNLLRKREDDITEKNDDGGKSDVIPEKDEDTSPNIVPNNGPEEEHEEDERTKAIRKSIAKHMRRKTGSFAGSRGRFLTLQNNQKEEEDIPSVLKELFEKAETMQVDEIREQSKKAIDGELFATLLGPEKDATGEDIMLTILKGFLRQRKKQVKKKNINEGVPRILLAAFFELFD